MKNILYILLFFVSSVLQAETYYVSKTGSDGNAGTLAAPWLTWQYGFTHISAGDTLYIRGGEYYTNGAAGGGDWNGVYVSLRNGTASDKIVVMNYPGETPVLNCEGFNPPGAYDTRAIKFNECNYWHIQGLTVRRVPEKGALAAGFYLEKSSHITFERCVSKHNGGPGFVSNNHCDYCYWINCDSWGNYDTAADGDFADGFIFSNWGSAGEYHIFVIGCRAWNNSDDGFDAFVSNDGNSGGYVEYTNCWSWKNGRGTGGDGDGFKWGGSKLLTESGVQRVIRYCLSFMNAGDAGIGIDQSESPYIGVIHNNTSYKNKGQGFYLDRNTASYFRNNIAYLNTGSAYYEDFGGFGTSIVVKDHNSWQSGYGYTMSADDFLSVDTTGVSGARQSDGSLPDLDFLKLAPTSDLIDKGVINVGYGITVSSYVGSSPDLGAFEYGEDEEPPEPPEPPIVDSPGTGIVVRGSDVVSSGGKLVKKN